MAKSQDYSPGILLKHEPVTKWFFVNMHLLRPHFSTLETTTLETVCEIKLKSFHTTFIEAQNYTVTSPSLKLLHQQLCKQ